jgi:hypothetical protein
MWKTMPLPLVIAMVAIAQFFQKLNSCGFANDLFNCDLFLLISSIIIGLNVIVSTVKIKHFIQCN